jgi:PAS domain S-box-containing protein
MKQSFFRTEFKFSIWIATLVVVVLIILLALTVNHAREKAIVEQFSRQQATIAGSVANGIEDLIVNIEKSSLLLSSLHCGESSAPPETVASIQAVYDFLVGKVQMIARLDETGTVVCGYPDSHMEGMWGKSFKKYHFFEKIKESHTPYVGKQMIGGTESSEGSDTGIDSIVIGIPKWDTEGEFTGAVLATISIHTIVDRYMCPARGLSPNDYLMVDEDDQIIINSNPEIIGTTARITEDTMTAPINKFFPRDTDGYGISHFRNSTGETIKTIIGYAPVRMGENLWSFVVVTPYDSVILLLRKASVNIMLGALGLIMAVIITGISIARSSARNVYFKEQLKLLQEREEWQGKLLREKKTIEGITEGSPIPTFVINREHIIILWNRACAELTGYGAEEMIGTDRHYLPFYNHKRPVIADFIIDQDIEGVKNYYGQKEIRKSERVRGAYEATDFFKDLGGKDRHLYFLAAPIYDEKGEITSVIETLQDISKENEMARNLREFANNLQRELTENINLRKEIEELYNYLQSIIDNLPEKIFDLSGDGIINYVSRDIKKERGAASREIKGKHFTDFVEPEHREYMLEKWEAAKGGIFTPYELEVTARDGSRRNLLITPSPVKGTDRYVLVQRDITELKNLENKYYESQKLAAVGQLSAGIAHEVRNPLSSIKMSLQILEKRIKPSGNDLKRFRIAQREVEHLEKLVNDVLIFARPSAPKKEFSDIKEILEHSLAMAEKSVSDKQIQVVKRFEKKIPLLEADPAMLEQAFLNVYHNAIDAMETKGTLLISSKRLSRDSEYVVVEIDDNGCGIEKEDLAHLFNPFFTRKRYGTGLGLSQVKKIIELHEGTVEILSKAGEGTRFRVTLPIGTKNPDEKIGP